MSRSILHEHATRHTLRHIALAGLRALRTVARVDGTIDALERELIDAVSTNILQLDVNVDELESIGADLDLSLPIFLGVQYAKCKDAESKNQY